MKERRKAVAMQCSIIFIGCLPFRLATVFYDDKPILRAIDMKERRALQDKWKVQLRVSPHSSQSTSQIQVQAMARVPGFIASFGRFLTFTGLILLALSAYRRGQFTCQHYEERISNYGLITSQP